MTAFGRRLLYSSIWKRFVFQFTLASLVFLVATLLIVLHVAMPTFTDQTRRATDKVSIQAQLELLRELRTEIEKDGLLAIDRRGEELVRRLADLDELQRLLRARLEPSTADAIHLTIKNLDRESRPFLQEYPAAGIIHQLHARMIMILVVIFFCIAGTMYVFVKDVVDPLEGIISTSREVAEGDLSVTFPVREEISKRDEIDDLAFVLNDLMANFQEAFLLIGTVNNDSRTATNEISRMLAEDGHDMDREALVQHVETTGAGAEEIDEILGSFDFYRPTSTGDEAAELGR